MHPRSIFQMLACRLRIFPHRICLPHEGLRTFRRRTIRVEGTQVADILVAGTWAKAPTSGPGEDPETTPQLRPDLST